MCIVKIREIHLSEESKVVLCKLLCQGFDFIFSAYENNGGGRGQ